MDGRRTPLLDARSRQHFGLVSFPMMRRVASGWMILTCRRACTAIGPPIRSKSKEMKRNSFPPLNSSV